MKPFFRWSGILLSTVLVCFLLYFNLQLYHHSPCQTLSGGQLDLVTLDQLHYLRRQLHEHHAAEDMQDLYPEGFVFTHALYALAWCEVVAQLPPESKSHQEGIQEIAFSLAQLQSKKGRTNFNAALPLPYGAFYRGWTTYLEGRSLQLFPPEQRDTDQIARFENNCTAIARSIQSTENPFLESYTDLCWPADNVVCLAALSLHDRFLAPRFPAEKATWLTRIKSTLDPDYQLIPHQYDLSAHISPEGVRGSSQSLMLCFLPEIDSVFAQEQYQQYRRHFLAYRLGLPGIREYPDGGSGDVDSGPVIMGLGGAACIVGIRAAALNGDWAVCVPLRRAVEALLIPREKNQERTYLFGQLPVLDAFMAWSNAGICAAESLELGNWRWQIQVFSICLGAFLVFLVWKTRTETTVQHPTGSN